MKTCTKCKKKKSLSGYYADSRATPPVQPCCKECFKKRAKKYRESDRGIKIIKRRTKSAKERQRVRDFLKKYRKTEKYKKWRNNYYRIYNKSYRKIPRVRLEYAIRFQKYMGKKRKNSDGTVTREALLRLLISQKYKCALCSINLKKNKKHIDHIVPISRNGKHSMKNIQWLCAHCNVVKSDKI